MLAEASEGWFGSSTAICGGSDVVGSRLGGLEPGVGCSLALWLSWTDFTRGKTSVGGCGPAIGASWLFLLGDESGSIDRSKCGMNGEMNGEEGQTLLKSMTSTCERLLLGRHIL